MFIKSCKYLALTVERWRKCENMCVLCLFRVCRKVNHKIGMKRGVMLNMVTSDFLW